MKKNMKLADVALGNAAELSSDCAASRGLGGETPMAESEAKINEAEEVQQRRIKLPVRRCHHARGLALVEIELNDRAS